MGIGQQALRQAIHDCFITQTLPFEAESFDDDSYMSMTGELDLQPQLNAAWKLHQDGKIEREQYDVIRAALEFEHGVIFDTHKGKVDGGVFDAFRVEGSTLPDGWSYDPNRGLPENLGGNVNFTRHEAVEGNTQTSKRKGRKKKPRDPARTPTGRFRPHVGVVWYVNEDGKPARHVYESRFKQGSPLMVVKTNDKGRWITDTDGMPVMVLKKDKDGNVVHSRICEFDGIAEAHKRAREIQASGRFAVVKQRHGEMKGNRYVLTTHSDGMAMMPAEITTWHGIAKGAGIKVPLGERQSSIPLKYIRLMIKQNRLFKGEGGEQEWAKVADYDKARFLPGSPLVRFNDYLDRDRSIPKESLDMFWNGFGQLNITDRGGWDALPQDMRIELRNAWLASEWQQASDDDKAAAETRFATAGDRLSIDAPSVEPGSGNEIVFSIRYRSFYVTRDKSGSQRTITIDPLAPIKDSSGNIKLTGHRSRAYRLLLDGMAPTHGIMVNGKTTISYADSPHTCRYTVLEMNKRQVAFFKKARSKAKRERSSRLLMYWAGSAKDMAQAKELARLAELVELGEPDSKPVDHIVSRSEAIEWAESLIEKDEILENLSQQFEDGDISAEDYVAQRGKRLNELEPADPQRGGPAMHAPRTRIDYGSDGHVYWGKARQSGSPGTNWIGQKHYTNIHGGNLHEEMLVAMPASFKQ